MFIVYCAVGEKTTVLISVSFIGCVTLVQAVTGLTGKSSIGFQLAAALHKQKCSVLISLIGLMLTYLFVLDCPWQFV